MKKITIILVGATGDLATTRLLPALYNLVKKNSLELQLIALGREPSSPQELFSHAAHYISSCDTVVLRKIIDSTLYKQADVINDDLKQFFSSIPMASQRVVYCATPSALFVAIAQKMHAYSVIEAGNANHRIVFEKPFGNDERSAQSMNKELHTILHEEQIYRIDHYLSKQLVSSLTILRKANVFFEPIWSCEYIERIEIIAYEQELVDNRTIFYDSTGALSDMMQNHLLQLVALLGMEIPDDVDTNPTALHNAKAKLLSHIQVSDGIVGQYAGYTEHAGVKPESKTETFAALQITINNDRWNTVQWFLATGKGLEKKRTEILIKFKQRSCPFVGPCEANYLHIYLTPQEGFDMTINMKKPHESTGLQSVDVQFCYSCLFATESPEAYEILLREIIAGERLLTVSFREIEIQWSIIDQARKKIATFIRYPQGSSNPAERFIEEL